MKKNPDTLHLFVKGKQGRCAFIITDASGTEIYNETIDGLNDEIPSHCDWDAIIKGLEYINKNRGTNKIPQDPLNTAMLDCISEVGGSVR